MRGPVMWGQGDPWGLWCPGIRGWVIPGGLGIGGEVAAVGDNVSEGTRGVGSALPHSGRCQWVSEGVLGSLSWYGGVGGSTSPQGEGAAVGTARQRGVTRLCLSQAPASCFTWRPLCPISTSPPRRCPSTRSSPRRGPCR